MDCLILYLASMSLQLHAKWHQILLGGVVGSVTALLTFTLQGVLLYVAKGLSLMLMCVATMGFGKKLFWYVLATCAYTFVLGGAIVGLFNLSQEGFVGGVIYQSDVPIFCYFLAMAVVVVIAKLIVAYVKDVKKVLPNVTKCQVVLLGTFTANALLDSGNSATCCGLPLCFVSKKFCDVFAKRILLGQTKQVCISTVVGNSAVIATKGQVVVNGTTFDVYFALGKTSPLYDVVLHSTIVATQNFCKGDCHHSETT